MGASNPDGKAAEQTLAGLISQVADVVTREAQEAGPMHQWEDLDDARSALK
ncbi:hypothetical protein ACFWM5_32645 [Streptomyces bobili]|uniref:hypothetical protein n=1 Tax=Streptomyces bobili TaxID=67280 RepID=UPI00364ED9D9